MSRSRREPHDQSELSFSSGPPPDPPTTRYQGSKAKLLPWLRGIIAPLAFDSALDLFSGTASVAFLLKTLGKRVHANDGLRANGHVARAIVQNNARRLDLVKARHLFEPAAGRSYGNFIAQTFEGVFFLPEENTWLDIVAENVARMDDPFEQSLAYFALFQACLKKRPFNLFHRKNLGLRTADVARSFGNKRTWDTSFEDHFLEALAEANRAVFDAGTEHVVTVSDALTLEATADLVYIDPPYMNGRGNSVDYLDFYHFLDGLTELDAWPGRIARGRAHLPYARRDSPLLRRDSVGRAFAALFERHKRGAIVLSYRSDGVPSAGELGAMLQALGKSVTVHHADQKYALSKKRTRELLFVAR